MWLARVLGSAIAGRAGSDIEIGMDGSVVEYLCGCFGAGAVVGDIAVDLVGPVVAIEDRKAPDCLPRVGRIEVGNAPGGLCGVVGVEGVT